MPRSVRSKIVALLMVPVVSLIALWAFATVTSARSVSDLNRLKEIDTTLVIPVGDFIAAVQDERSAAARAVAAPDAERQQTLRDRRRATDAAATALRDGVNGGSADAADVDPQLPGRIDRLMRDAAQLTALRARHTTGKDATDRTTGAYGEIVDHGLATLGALSGLQNPPGASQPRVVLELARARDVLSREDAALGAAQAAGRMSPAQFDAFTGAAHTQRDLFAGAVDDLAPADAAAYHRILNGTAYRDLRSAEDAVRDAGPGIRAATAVPAADWSDAHGTVLRALRTAQRSAGTAAARTADPLSLGTLGGSGLAVVLGLAGVLLSLLISVKIGRRLVIELEELRNSALRVAGRDLPRSLRRLYAGKSVDIDAVAPLPADRGAGRDEVGQVGEALVAVHRTALKAAADRAEALSGISGVYVSLARRSQLLVHRQLALLDTMERRTEDPAELEDLFRLDHLTTRMRRHAESLIILSGAAPGRGWRHPVPLLDVVRAAVAEVEDFARVEVSAVAEVRLAGGAVADLTHLLAELVENAVTFSPPHTKVQVHAERVGTGLALEIHDRGLGMSTEALDEANRRIADADEIDLLDTERLGLFVVNRLAHRQQARVTLQPSAYGGVTAVVLLPDDVLAEAAPDDGGAPEEMTSLYHRRRPARARALGAAISRPAALPAAPEPPVAGTAPAPEAPMSERPAPPEPAPADLDGPLPRRVRQASLAPDLRDEPQHKPEWVPRTEVTAAPRRSPEQARATMASLRAGWTRGRAATAPRDGAHGPITPDDATPDDATPDDAAPGHDPQGETAP
ncbi:nitrate- and nitrite sensing domain-containing protein [Streptomyces natalensis]|uniref:sensor histidine kinase n=1 Tax=Streptomyces natalensis TaxID=68242 RepID=UPI00099DFDD5|nr:nitrate- and nitrite sensing domain-containing protein [Streptomyces natalensis]